LTKCRCKELIQRRTTCRKKEKRKCQGEETEWEYNGVMNLFKYVGWEERRKEEGGKEERKNERERGRKVGRLHGQCIWLV
jgi:hypothetical protein